MADDLDIQQRITALIDEEHRLRDALQDRELSAEEERDRLGRLEVELDQCWDLLRQRRAKREFGGDAGEAKVRDPKVVEGYTG